MEAIKLSRVLLLTTAFSISVLTTAAIFPHFSAQAKDQKTEIVIDESKNAIHFIVDGQDIAVITLEGLHVYGDVSYNGMMMDGTPDNLKNGGSGE